MSRDEAQPSLVYRPATWAERIADTVREGLVLLLAAAVGAGVGSVVFAFFYFLPQLLVDPTLSAVDGHDSGALGTLINLTHMSAIVGGLVAGFVVGVIATRPVMRHFPLPGPGRLAESTTAEAEVPIDN